MSWSDSAGPLVAETISVNVNAYIDFGASEEEVETLRSAFARHGMEANVVASNMRFHQGDLPWVLIIEAYVALRLFDGFLTAAGAEVCAR